MSERAFLTAEWRNLVVLNYEMDPAVLSPFTPEGTELDDWQGKTLVSLVAFQFLNTRVCGVAVPFHRNFEEMNLRCYVRRLVDDAPRRAVVFLREVVPRRVVAALARLLYNEPYTCLPMRSRVRAGPPPTMEYGWHLKGRWNTCAARGTGVGAEPAPGTFEEFITEHYWGYTRQRDGSTVEYRVEHPPWKVWPAEAARIDGDLEALYGAALGSKLGRPHSAFVADGSTVTVFTPNPVKLKHQTAGEPENAV
jgi:uncharacterized protein YqjF (DUF2071 family)